MDIFLKTRSSSLLTEFFFLNYFSKTWVNPAILWMPLAVPRPSRKELFRRICACLANCSCRMRPRHCCFPKKQHCLPGVRYANIHTEQRDCLSCIFAQIWVLGDNSTKLAHCLAESGGLSTLTKTKKLLITF